MTSRYSQLKTVRAFQRTRSAELNLHDRPHRLRPSLSKGGHRHVRVPRRRASRHVGPQEGLQTGGQAEMELPDPLRPVDDQERGSARLHGPRPLQYPRGTGEERRSGVDAGQAILRRESPQASEANMGMLSLIWAQEKRQLVLLSVTLAFAAVLYLTILQ